ncbi:MAG: hypothetical protein ACFFCE_12320 [Promethearchaeota archaeon]
MALQFGVNLIQSPYKDSFPRFLPAVFIMMCIFNFIGLIFGTTSTMNNQQARELESLNTFIKVGTMLGIIGIILNSILMLISLVMIGLV